MERVRPPSVPMWGFQRISPAAQLTPMSIPRFNASLALPAIVASPESAHANRPPHHSFRSPAEAEHSAPDADRLLAGNPQLTVWNYYADPANQFFAGIWAATRGRWRVRYTEHEFCLLLSGRVLISSESGERHEFSARDSFVISAGFAGIWEVVEDCRKVYAIFEPRTSGG